jgi:hypothetical protein
LEKLWGKKIMGLFYLTRMKLISNGKGLFSVLGIVLFMFVVVSLLDIVVAVLYSRFYSTAAFIVTFGVGGVFAAFFAFTTGIGQTKEKTEQVRWSLIILLIVCGLLFFFPLATLEGGEYKAAFKAYGVMLCITTFLFMKGDVWK